MTLLEPVNTTLTAEGAAQILQCETESYEAMVSHAKSLVTEDPNLSQTSCKNSTDC